MEEPIVISFYTDDRDEYADRMVDSCRRLGLNYHIAKKENTITKPLFIRDRLQQFQKPVIWFDIDGELLRSPNLAGLETDFAACRNTNKEVTDRDWALSVLWFNYTLPAIDFLDQWCVNSESDTEEASFDATWKSLRGTLMPCILPVEYHVVTSAGGLGVPENTIFSKML